MSFDETIVPRVAHLHGGKTMCGCAAYIFTLIEAMQGTSYDPVLILIAGGEVAEAADRRGIPYLVVGKKTRCDLRGVFKLRALLRRERIEILHTHTLNGNFYGRMAALTLPRLRLVTTVHTYVERVIDDITGGASWRGRMMLWQNRWLGLRNQAFVAASQHLRQSILGPAVPLRKTHLVYNGIRLADPGTVADQRDRARAFFGLADGEIAIGTAVRLVPSKNVEGLLRAGARLREQGAAHRLIVIGDGPELSKLKDVAADLRLGEGCLFAGWRSDAAALIPAFDIYVQPSFEENFPYAILEAMSAGCPVVCYQTGSHADMVAHGVSGYVCPNGDQEALSRSLLQLVEDAGMRAAYGRAARQRVTDNFTIEGMQAAMAAVYDRVLQQS